MSKMIKGLIIFGTGIYAGVYIAQNYEIDKVEEPVVLIGKLKAFVKSKYEEFSKPSK